MTRGEVSAARPGEPCPFSQSVLVSSAASCPDRASCRSSSVGARNAERDGTKSAFLTLRRLVVSSFLEPSPSSPISFSSSISSSSSGAGLTLRLIRRASTRSALTSLRYSFRKPSTPGMKRCLVLFCSSLSMSRKDVYDVGRVDGSDASRSRPLSGVADMPRRRDASKGVWNADGAASLGPPPAPEGSAPEDEENLAEVSRSVMPMPPTPLYSCWASAGG